MRSRDSSWKLILLCAGIMLVTFNVAHVLSPSSQPRQRVAVIGLGAMGYPMAATLARAGFQVQVHNRSPAKADRHARQHGTEAIHQLKDLAADFILTVLPTSADVEQVAKELAESGALRPRQIWLDATTGAPQVTQRISTYLEQLGVSLLDAPVSGGPHGAEKAELTIMAGGNQKTFNSALPVLTTLGKGPRLVGAVGAGHALKAANNALLATHIWAAGEAISMVQKFGVDASAAVSIINKASGFSAATNGIFPDRVLKRDFTKRFGLGLMEKDIRVAVDAANANDLSTPVLSAAAEMWRVAKKEIGLDVDCSEAIKVIEQWAGQPIQ